MDGRTQGWKEGQADAWKEVQTDIWKFPPCVLQEIGLLGPLPKKVELVMQSHNIVVDGHPA